VAHHRPAQIGPTRETSGEGDFVLHLGELKHGVSSAATRIKVPSHQTKAIQRQTSSRLSCALQPLSPLDVIGAFRAISA
jgi:hypothetical protein